MKQTAKLLIPIMLFFLFCFYANAMDCEKGYTAVKVCDIQEAKVCKTECYLNVNAKEERISLFRRIWLDKTFFYIAYDNHGNMGYKRSAIIGIANELDYKNIFLWNNDFWYNPLGKIIAGGYYLDWTSKPIFVKDGHWLLSGLFRIDYTHNSQWAKTGTFFGGGFGYRWNDGYSARATVDYVYGFYNDDISTRKYGLEFNTYGELPYNFIMISKLGVYHLSANDDRENSAVSAMIGIGYHF